MSIHPNDANRSEPVSSLNNPLKNPNSHHGFVDRDPRRRIESLSIQDSRGGPRGSSPSAVAEIAGSAGAHFGCSCDSDKNVAEHRSSHAMNGSYDQSIGIFCLGRPTIQGGISSEFGPALFGPQINRQPSGTGKLLQSDPSASGPSELQGNAVRSASRRNQVGNANHLLNFFYDPISRSLPRAPPSRRQRKIKPYNRDLFLQANYKFVVLDTGKYHVESMDPDKMLQWEDIVCVRYSTPFAIQCPICLETPLCPQITSCGHIYCFPCILRYLLMGKEDHKGDCWKKCPLCFMMISSKDLCTIQIENVKQFDIGDHVHFVLLTRRKDSLVPSLKYQQEEGPMQYGSDELHDSFSKYTSTSDVKLSVQEAKSDLNNWLIKAGSGVMDDLERLPYVCAAFEQLEERIKNWMDQVAVSDTLINSSSTSKCKVINTPNKSDSTAVVSTSPSDHVDLIVRESGSPVKGMLFDKDRASQSTTDAGGGDSYTFYQAIDGQHLILHPLNMKCLLHHYGSYDMLPSRINGRILEMEMLTQSEVIRKRYRFSSHFTLTTSIQLCEIDLGEILPPTSLAPFQDEIKKREIQRRQVARKERNEKARADTAALHMMPVIYDQKYLQRKDATFSSDDFEALGSGVAPSSPPINSEKKLFSDVTRLGFAAAHDSPSLKGEGSADHMDKTGETSNTQGMLRLSNCSADHMDKTGETSNTQGTRPMAMTQSFASIMSAAKVTGGPAMQSTKGVGKKGKKPTKILLSTAGGRRY